MRSDDLLDGEWTQLDAMPPSDAALPARHRASLLADAFGLRRKLGSVSRRRPPASAMPGVIEISARNNTTVSSAHRDCEHEERERLRDAAAQSIGLGPELLAQSHLSLDSLPAPPCPLPPFPAPLPALRPFVQLAATVPKFAPHASLLVYALARQWKPRTIVLTATPHETHVHLFKASAKHDREIERLQVTEDTLIFVAEEDVGGRRQVVKFAARDVSARRGAPLRAMWLLQMTDPVECQRWIAAIKSAVLAQRAVRAGLDISAPTSATNQPKGDMDVMLSMHLQGIITMARPSPTISLPSHAAPSSPSPTASLRSAPSPSPTTTVRGLFSTRPRSPSIDGSVAHTSPHTEDSFGVAGTSLLTMLRNKSSADSTSSPAHSLPLSPSTGSGRDSPAPSQRSANVPVITASDLKISRERDTPDLTHAIIPDARPATAPPIPSLATQGTLTFSLQPPPRKCKNVVPMPPALLLPEQKTMYKQAGGNRSVAGNFGIPSKGSGDETPGETSPVSPESFRFSAGQSDSFLPRVGLEAPSLSIDDSEEGEDMAPPGNTNEVASFLCPSGYKSQNAVITKRWSRQGATLPKQPAPPSKPPPSIPLSSETSRRTSMESIPIVRSLEYSASTSSFNSLPRTRTSPQSGSSLSPTFWKRASLSSTYSVGSVSTSDSQIRPLVPVSAISGDSFSPSPKPVASYAASSRPMSLYVPGPSPVAHMGTTKRRSMPPPRPAPKFAPPPAPIAQESPVPGPSRIPASKSFRSSVAQRALRLSLTSPKPPPSTALPPRPDEPAITRGHRRGSSAGTSDLHPSASSSRPLSTTLDPNPSTPPPSRTLSIRQRLRILSTPPASHSPAQSPPLSLPPLQVSTLDLSDDIEIDNEDDLPTPYLVSPQSFGLGEHITTMPNEPSFLQLSSVAPATSNGGLGTPPFDPDCEFVALSPPPPRRGSKPFAVPATRTEKVDGGEPQAEENALLALSHSASVVSLGFVTR